MNLMEYLRSMRERLTGRQREPFDPQAVLQKFESLPMGENYLYLRTLPYNPVDTLMNNTYINFGSFRNAMEYDALLGGFGIPQLKYIPEAGMVKGPRGFLPFTAMFQWNTPDHRPPAYFSEGVLRRR